MEGRRFKSALFFGLAMGLIVLSAIGYKFYSIFLKPMIDKTSAPITIIVDRNTSASDFVRMLESKQLVSSHRLFLSLIRFKGLAHRLKAGIYQITPGESALHFLYKVEAGEVLVESFRIIEGTNLNQVSINLQNAPYLEYKPSDWLPIIGTHSSAEGLLLADTYNYNAGSEAKFLLRLANQKLQQYLSESWQNRSPNLPYQTPYELLIAASILEKEASIPAEKKIISGVIVNRIKKNMPLQMDPTVIYALGKNYTGKLTHEDMSVNSPYNTYLHRGLPPTPIAMVGKEAIDAAAHPLVTNYLYYVAKGDGSHYFSETYEEQKKAIEQYQK
ncbi:endolytic transglycosylase MltG [Legionella micdadei]|uniref:endolytic transglycosylase MltG n=1 Tax=Legionella micdadei TaxID=451 RepID=UPI0009EF6EF5|nr:endolytic transglycosylase MltG [Legionella micdadei]ARH00203.1 ABC transporter substrate-binding protein [Legionella micdadei]